MKKLDFILTLLIGFLFILGCVFIFVSDNLISFGFSLIMPILLVLNLFFSVYWLVKKNKIFLLSLFCIIVYFLNFDLFFQFNSNKSVDLSNTSSNLDTLSILSYNTQGFSHQKEKIKTGIERPIVNFIKNKNPDIFCIQEFSAIQYRYFKEYPHYFKTNIIAGKGKSVMAIFSKYPIIDKEYIRFPNSGNGAMYVDLLINNEVIRIYNMHLESYKMREVYKVYSPKGFFKLMNRIGVADKLRKEQAILVKKHMDKFKGTVVLCGDFNSTQFSSAYNVLKDNLKDTYIEAGRGFGATYELFKYPFRLDYILVDESFEVLTHQNFDLKYSDHEPILTKLLVK